MINKLPKSSFHLFRFLTGFSEASLIQATLDKTFAKLYIAQNDLPKALEFLTKGIY